MLVAAADDDHRIPLAQQDEVHQQAGYASVAVFKRVYADVSVMKQRGEFDGGVFIGVRHTVVPVHEVVHESRCLFGGGVVETLSRGSDDGVRACLVAACVYHITGLYATGQLPEHLIILPQHRALHVPYEALRQGMVAQRLRLHHLQAYVVRLHLFQVLHLGRADHLAEQQQHFRLSVGEHVPLDVVAVEVEVEHELSPKPPLVFRREGLQRLPLLIEFLYLSHGSGF